MLARNNIGLDTSVVLRLLTGEPQNQFQKAKQFIEDQLKNHKKLFICDLVIAETYHALHYHYEVPKKEAIEQLNNFLFYGIVQPLPGSVCKKVFQEIDHCKAGLVDQLIYEQYLTHTDHVVSFDKSMLPLGSVIGL